ncbi:hypothetical protein EV359DRAFT_87596 [Lentinula novae-zelandiae]|nr:hypothetical protein EV359DRAFT_87596 [Lentinula novae-zelandiae]
MTTGKITFGNIFKTLKSLEHPVVMEHLLQSIVYLTSLADDPTAKVKIHYCTDSPVVLAGSAYITSSTPVDLSDHTATTDCSALQHALDPRDQQHVHHIGNSWYDCDSQPCPHALSNSVQNPITREDTTFLPSPHPRSPTPIMSTSAHTTSADDLMTQLIKQVANLATAMEEHSSSKKPKVFKGKNSSEARRFRAQFQNWASEQPDLANSQVKLIKSALGFFTEGAGDWATLHLLHFSAENPPFEGSWKKFLIEFGQQFESIDPGMKAHHAI